MNRASGRLTSDPVPQEQLEADAAKVLDYVAAGGVAIVPLDVAYAVNAATSQGIRAIFRAKQRSYEKPSGMFANGEMSRDIHILEDWKHDLVDTLLAQEQFPFSVVAPFREDHDFFQSVESFVLESSSRLGTLDMLLNAGQLHNELAKQSWQRKLPLFGSSANTSLAGSKYCLGDIEEPVRAVAGIALDYGRSTYANDAGLSSTIIDFESFHVIRRGVCFDEVKEAFSRHAGVSLILDAHA